MFDATYRAMSPPAAGRTGAGLSDAAQDAGPTPPADPAAESTAEPHLPANDRRLEEALEETEALWQAGKFSEAVDVLTRLQTSAEIGNYRGDERLLVTRIALLYEDMGNLPKALEFHFRRLELALKQPYTEGQKAQIRCYDNISYLYLRQGKEMLFRTYCEKSEQVRREMLRFEAESRMPSRALSDAEEHEQQQQQRREEARVSMLRRNQERAERELAERLNLENEGLVELIKALKVPMKKRDEADINKIQQALEPIEYFQKRTNDHQRRELCRLAKYETHIEAFSMYERGDPADRAWIILGCTPFLEDYQGSVDVMAWGEESKTEVVSSVVHYGNLFGEDALDGASTRVDHVVVSDDGHDDVITTNHFLTIMRDDFEQVINTYYHDRFEVQPGTRELDCKYANLGDGGVGELCWFLINSRNKVLVSLDLQLNNIGPEGAHRVADLMTHNRAITHLDLSRNHIGDLGVEGLCKALGENTSLKKLSLRSNQITQRSRNPLQQLLESNTVLTSLDLKENTLCYSEAFKQCTDYATQHNYLVHTDEQQDWSLLKLAQTREHRAQEAAELALKRLPARGWSASTCTSDAQSSSSTANGWKWRQCRFGATEESYETHETEAVLKRLRLALMSSRSYQYRVNQEGAGVLRKEFLKMDVSKRRTLEQRDLIQCFAHFDLQLSVEDAALLALSFGCLPYKQYGSERSSMTNTPAAASRARKQSTARTDTSAVNSRPNTRGSASRQDTRQSGSAPQSRPNTITAGQGSTVGRALSRIAKSRQTEETQAENFNDLLVVWPAVVEYLEGGCSELIDQFFKLEKLERSVCVFCVVHIIIILSLFDAFGATDLNVISHALECDATRTRSQCDWNSKRTLTH